MTAQAAAALQARFAHIADTRMAGLPLMQPGLRVQAVGFAPLAAEPGLLLGVLVTPWFMNLVRLPVAPQAAAALSVAAPGQRLSRRLGDAVIEFIGAEEPTVGPFEACSLYSPMHTFRDQAGAVAVAEAVLAALRQATEQAPVQPARRGFLLGRTAGAAR